MFGTGCYGFELQSVGATWERRSHFQRQQLLIQAKSILCRQRRGRISPKPELQILTLWSSAMGLAEVGEDSLLLQDLYTIYHSRRATSRLLAHTLQWRCL